MSNDQILSAIKEARERAKEAVEVLGMKDFLTEKKCWENPPTAVFRKDDKLSDDDDHDDVEDEPGDITQLLDKVSFSEDPTEIESSISQLSSAGLIEKDLSDRLRSLHRSSFKRLPDSSLPLFEKVESDAPLKERMPSQKHSPVVEITHEHSISTRQQLRGCFRKGRGCQQIVFFVSEPNSRTVA